MDGTDFDHRAFTRELRRVLVDGMRSLGIDAQVKTKSVRGLRMKRVAVVADNFGGLQPGERLDTAWRILKVGLGRSHFHVAALAVLTPAEYAEYGHLIVNPPR